MNGQVDHANRALLTIAVAASRTAKPKPIVVWVDTAFNGDFVFPYREIERLKLPQSSSTRAMLADGQTVELETFECFLNWFGKSRRVEVVANEGQLPLLGTSLYAPQKLTALNDLHLSLRRLNFGPMLRAVISGVWYYWPDEC